MVFFSLWETVEQDFDTKDMNENMIITNQQIMCCVDKIILEM